MNYFENINPIIKDYSKILSPEIPEFLKEYIKAPELINQNGISVICGTFIVNYLTIIFCIQV